MEILHGEGVDELSCVLQVMDDMVAFRVDVRGDVMSDFTRRVTQSDPLVVSGRSKPDRAAVRARLVPFPEADVVTLPGIVADGLLERQILLAAEKEQVADRRVSVLS